MSDDLILNYIVPSIVVFGVLCWALREIFRYYHNRNRILIKLHYLQIGLAYKLLEFDRRISEIDGKPFGISEETEAANWLEEIDIKMERRGCPCFRCHSRRSLVKP